MANTLAKTRERRSNAGSRMAQMLDKEEDDFYKSTYGGFFEEEDDQVYVSEDSESDNVDSDFDIDERDEVIEQEEDEGDKRKKRTKAFREPVRKVVERKSVSQKKPAQSKERPTSIRQSELIGSPNKSKNLRTSTQIKSEDTRKRKRLAERNRKTVTRKSYRELTQEELLAEARETEKLNIKSLERYQKLELEKSRKNKISKERITGPFIRFQSLTMPLIDEQLHDENDKKDRKCSRNFVTFSEEQLFLDSFGQINTDKKCTKASTLNRTATCPVTKLPARYFDPVTNLPYANSFAFKTLRNAYVKQLALIETSCLKGEADREELKRFLDWQRKNSAKLKSENSTSLINPNGISSDMPLNETSPKENL